jgi:hypothetical protein
LGWNEVDAEKHSQINLRSKISVWALPVIMFENFIYGALAYRKFTSVLLILNSPMLALGMSKSKFKIPYIDKAQASQHDTPTLGSGRVHSYDRIFLSTWESYNV